MPFTSFLDITPEIRLSIYREVFRRLTISFTPPAFINSTPARVHSDDPQEEHHLSILLTCRTLYREAKPLLLANILFDLSCPKAINTILPLEFIRMPRIIISAKSISAYLQARNFYFQDMATLLRGKNEIQVEITKPSLHKKSITENALRRDLQHLLTQNLSNTQKNLHPEGELLNDCIDAMYPANNDDDDDDNTTNDGATTTASCTAGIFLLLRPSRHLRLRCKDQGKELRFTERKLQYDRATHTLELLEPPPGADVSVPVP